MKNTLKQEKQLKALTKRLGVPFSSELGINLQEGNEEETFKWFLASVLFGKRISFRTAIKTYKQFKLSSVLTPRAIINAGWDGLAKILDDGGYVRYDFSTASKLLELVRQPILWTITLKSGKSVNFDNIAFRVFAGNRLDSFTHSQAAESRRLM